MKTMNRYLFPLFALLALIACTEDDTSTDTGNDAFRIIASLDASAGAWQSGDQIKVVCADELYTCTTAESGQSVEFADQDRRLSDALIGKNPVSAYRNCTSMYGTFRIQAEQTANDGVNTATIPAFAYTMNNPEQNRLSLAFKPLASTLELAVQPYDLTITKLTIEPAEEATISGGAMAGAFTVNAAQSTVAINNGINSLIVDFNGGLNLSQGATLRIPMGWFAIEGGLKLTFRYGTKDYVTTLWADKGIVRTFTDNSGFKSARVMHEEFEFDANAFPRAYYVKVDAPSSNKGLTWDAPTSLSAALRNAMAGSTLHIAAGTYSPENWLTGGSETDNYKCFEVFRNISLIGGYAADAAAGAESDPATNKVILDGGGTSFHTLVVSAPKLPNEKVVINGLTITGGKNIATDSESVTLNGIKLPGNYAAGVAVVGTRVEFASCNIEGNNGNSAAGLYSLQSELKITNSKINNNTATANGGGVWITSGTQLTMSNSTIDNNTSVGLAAGLYLYTPAGEGLEASISNTSISDNTATNNAGGIYIRDDSGSQLLHSSFTDCTISGNKGAMGGAIILLNAKTSLIGCRITDNEATGNGVIYPNTTGTGNSNTLFDKCTIHNNKTGGTAVASGIYAYNAGGSLDLLITNSTLSNNVTASRGGAIYARNAKAGSTLNATCVNSTFVGNQSGSFGGAIAMYGSATMPTNVSLISCTLTGNICTSATNAGGAVGLETAGLTLKTYNTIASGNTASGAANNFFVKGGITASVTHNSTIAGDRYFNAAGAESATSPAFTASTMLAELSDNGGSTRTCLLIGNTTTNFALGNGMTATALKALATSDLTAEVLGTDQLGAERNDTNLIMGACVKK